MKHKILFPYHALVFGWNYKKPCQCPSDGKMILIIAFHFQGDQDSYKLYLLKHTDPRLGVRQLGRSHQFPVTRLGRH